MDNSYNQSDVAYETGPKETNKDRKANSDQSFGKGKRMPQENVGYEQKDYPANPRIDRYGEHR